MNSNKRKTPLDRQTFAARQLLHKLTDFEQDVASMEGYRPSVFKRVTELRRSLEASVNMKYTYDERNGA